MKKCKGHRHALSPSYSNVRYTYLYSLLDYRYPLIFDIDYTPGLAYIINRNYFVFYSLRSETLFRGHQKPAQDPNSGRGPIQHSWREHGGRNQGTVDDADCRSSW